MTIKYLLNNKLSMNINFMRERKFGSESESESWQ